MPNMHTKGASQDLQKQESRRTRNTNRNLEDNKQTTQYRFSFCIDRFSRFIILCLLPGCKHV